jgi:hypothetical protein
LRLGSEGERRRSVDDGSRNLPRRPDCSEGIIGDRQQPSDGFSGSDLARFAEAIETPSGPAQDSLHSQIRDGCDRLRVVLLTPFNHRREQQERRFP